MTHGAGVNLNLSGGAKVEVVGPQVSISGAAQIRFVSGGWGIQITPGSIDITSAAPITITAAVVKINS